MNDFLIKLVMLLSPFYKRYGVNSDQLRIILQVKLKLDARRHSGFRGKKQKKASGGSWGMIVFSSMMGLLFCFFLISFKQPYLSHGIYFSSLMVMLSFVLITDFSNVLLDTRDNFIILPRPVNDTTFIFARVIHIILHISKLVFCLTFAGLILMFIKEGPVAGSVFIIEVLVATTITILLINSIYLLLLKICKPEKFKDVISYFQILFGIIIFSANYLLPKLFHFSDTSDVNITSIKGVWLLPPLWIASLHELVSATRVDSLTAGMAVAAVSSPFVSLFLIVKVLAPGFNKRLAASSGSASDETGTGVSDERKTGAFYKKLANLVSPHPLENAGFRITWLLSSRSRDFKVKVYPSFAYVPVYFLSFGILGNKAGSFAERWQSVKNGHLYILLAYLSCFVLTTIFQNISYSEKFKSSWIYFTTPIASHGRIMGGMFKALILKFHLPFFALISAFAVSVWGFQVLNDLFLSFFVSLLFALIMSLFTVKGLPFSQQAVMKGGGAKAFFSIFLILIPLGFGLGHYWFINWEKSITVISLLMAVIVYVLFRYYVKETYDGLELAE